MKFISNSKSSYLILFVCLLLTHFYPTNSLSADNPQAYQIFDGKGAEKDWNEILKAVKPGTIVLFGELHNNAIAHWLQLELLQDLHKQHPKGLSVGMEMFEADDQIKIDEYLSGAIAKKNFKADARFWKNYDTDYDPILEFCKENELQLVASNVPRRYASKVYKEGLESLDELSNSAKSYLPPLPIVFDPELPAYAGMMEMMGTHAPNPNFPKAQAIKDATMAHFILKRHGKSAVFLHLNGAYHSDNKQGIYWYLNHYNEGLKILTISTVEQSELSKLEEDHQEKADFIIVVKDNLTKTH